MSCFSGGIKALALLYFAKIGGCMLAYAYQASVDINISIDIHEKFVDMDMDMDE